MSDLVEQAYAEFLERQTAAERIKMVSEMTQFMINTLRHGVRQKHPDFTEEQVKLQAARELYYDDPEMLRLLDIAWKRAGG